MSILYDNTFLRISKLGDKKTATLLYTQGPLKIWIEHFTQLRFTKLQLREDSRSTPGFYGPWSLKILKSWSLIRSKMANFWQLWQSKSSFPSISNDILDLIYLIRYYLPIHKMHCMWMYCKSKVKVFWARLCNLLEKDWQHSRLDTWLGNHPFCIC